MAESAIKLDAMRKAEDANTARLVQHDVSHKKGDGGGSAFKKHLKDLARIAQGQAEHNDAKSFAKAIGQ